MGKVGEFNKYEMIGKIENFCRRSGKRLETCPNCGLVVFPEISGYCPNCRTEIHENINIKPTGSGPKDVKASDDRNFFIKPNGK